MRGNYSKITHYFDLVNFEKFLPPKGRSEQARSTFGGGRDLKWNTDGLLAVVIGGIVGLLGLALDELLGVHERGTLLEGL